MTPVATGLRQCENGVKYKVCNWLVSAASPSRFCTACRLNQLVPDMCWDRNKMLWARVETAKRRLVYTLSRLGIPVVPKSERRDGLAFEIVSTVLNPSVTTGHLNGVITVNLEEADDTYRQINRQQLGEASRTLLGHFRHEIAHYFWSRHLSDLAWGSPERVAFREKFGDEWLDYGRALSSHYQLGAPASWHERYISAYASSHPWEDWAETWACYLQMLDGLETCAAMGIQVQHLSLPLASMPGEAGFLPTCLPQRPQDDDAFLAMLQRWGCLYNVLNEVADSSGEPKLYPFVISTAVAQKLRLVHYFALSWGAGFLNLSE